MHYKFCCQHKYLIKKLNLNRIIILLKDILTINYFITFFILLTFFLLTLFSGLIFVTHKCVHWYEYLFFSPSVFGCGSGQRSFFSVCESLLSWSEPVSSCCGVNESLGLLVTLNLQRQSPSVDPCGLTWRAPNDLASRLRFYIGHQMATQHGMTVSCCRQWIIHRAELAAVDSDHDGGMSQPVRVGIWLI